MYYLVIFLATLAVSVILTLIVKRLAIKFKILDWPNRERKIHQKGTPLLGGVAVFLSFFLMLFIAKDKILAGDLEFRHWLGFFIGALFIIIGGFLDDKYDLKPKYQIIWPILAILSVIAGGVEVEKITNPLGGFLELNEKQINILGWNFVIFSDLLILFWLLGMMYTTKLLDGIDGLVSSVTFVGGIIIFLFTMTTKYYQPDIGLAALILSASVLGFLFFNWNPAKIFLGEGGSLFLGFAIGVLAIISGGKIAIALLIMGIPIMDVVWTIIRRLKNKQNPFLFSDKKHLHFRLLHSGFSQKKVALLFCLFSIIFGISGLFLQSSGKMLALAFLMVIMLLMVIIFSLLDKKHGNN